MARFVSCLLTGLLVLLAQATVLATNDKYKQQLTGASIQQNAVLQVQDARYSEMQAGNFPFTNVSVSDEIMLAIDLKTFTPTADFTSTVGLSIQYDEWNGSQFVAKTTTASLTVNYTSQGSFRDKAVYRVAGGHKLRITVTSVSGPVNMVVLTGSISIRRYDNFDASTTVSGVTSDFKTERGELVISWSALTGAEEYDLEWTWVNDYANADAARPADKINLNRNTFRLNSSRVTIVGREHAIPMVYDRGYIIYRVRGIGRGGAQYTTPLEGRWTYEPQDNHSVADAPDKYLYYGHQNNLNWQASVSYAEEGKNKVSVNYFDGGLRNRQAVSRLNTEDKIIVGETLYDHQGRPAIQVLPVPAPESKLGYQRSFNQNQEGKPYSREDFDTDDEACQISPPGLSTASGASQYYSPANPDKEGVQAYLPDAKQYPFTQTEYTPDNTGRIRRQSGVGSDHKLGSGHETKYYYGKPFQEELDKMFGNDVGYADHYKKNMVRDANGQISVSYLDPKGRVIATSLAGETPANLHNIAKPEETVTTTVDLLGKRLPSDRMGLEDHLSSDGRTRTLSREMLVTQEGTRSFNYDVKAERFTEECLINNTPIVAVCYGCVVDLNLSVTDECGNEVIPAIGSNGVTYVQVGEVDADCSTNEIRFAKEFQTANQLLPGNYTVTRKLSINENALEEYTKDYLARQDSCFLTFDHFLRAEAKNIQLFDCEVDCQGCRNAVGEYGKYTGPNCNPCLTPEEYQELLSECDFLCNDEVVQCSNAYNMMLADLSPFGQYGEVMNAIGIGEDGGVVVPEGPQEIDPSAFPLSVFNENNKLPKNKTGIGNWKFPKDGAYLSADGTPASVDVLAYEEEDGTLMFTPAIDADAVPANVKHGDVFQVPPHKLTNVKEFLASWDAAWAQQLVHLHPEHGYYNFCTILESSHRWDAKFLGVDSYKEAKDLGFFASGDTLAPNPLAAGSNLTDPYFHEVRRFLENNVSSSWISYNAKEFEAMTRSINNYSESEDIWYIVHRTVNCPFDDSNSNVCQVCPAYDGINTDAEWNTFKSLYFSLKQQFVERKTSLYAINNDCYNGCIGSERFDPFAYSFYKHNVFDFIKTLSLLTDSDQPCNWSSWKTGLYKDKSKRFPLSSDMINVTDLDLEACYTGFDETTPGDVETLPADQQVACSNSLRDILEDTNLESDISFYESCGQCPVVFDLQTLLDALAQRKELEGDNVQLSCYPESNYPEFVPDLKEALEATLPGDGKWYWDKVSATNGELIVNLTKSIGGTCELRMKILTPGINFSSVESICCMNHTEQPTFYPLTGNGNFIVKAAIKNRAEKVTIEGFISCLDLTTCPFPPKCEPVKDATELQTLMNALLFDFTVGGKSDDLFSSAPVNLNADPYKPIVDGTLNALRTTLTGNAWTWRSSTAGNVLSGYIEDGNGGSCLVELRPAINIAFDVRKIVGFSNIRPDREHPDDPQKNFLITAIVDTDQGKIRVKMKGYSGCFAIGTCTPVVVKP